MLQDSDRLVARVAVGRGGKILGLGLVGRGRGVGRGSIGRGSVGRGSIGRGRGGVARPGPVGRLGPVRDSHQGQGSNDELWI